MEANGQGMFVQAIQGMRPNLVATRWNFGNFQSKENHGTSAIVMEFTTTSGYGKVDASSQTRVESARHTYGKDGWHRLVSTTQDPWLMAMLGALPGEDLLDGFKQFVAGSAPSMSISHGSWVLITKRCQPSLP